MTNINITNKQNRIDLINRFRDFINEIDDNVHRYNTKFIKFKESDSNIISLKNEPFEYIVKLTKNNGFEDHLKELIKDSGTTSEASWQAGCRIAISHFQKISDDLSPPLLLQAKENNLYKILELNFKLNSPWQHKMLKLAGYVEQGNYLIGEYSKRNNNIIKITNRYHEKVDTLESAVRDLKSEIDGLENQKGLINAQIKDLNGAVKRLEYQNQKLTESCHKLEGNHSDYEALLRNIKKEKDDKQEALNKLNTELDILQRKHDKVYSYIEQEPQIKETLQKIEEYERKEISLGQLENTIADEQSKLELLRTTITNEKQKYEGLTSEIARNESKIESLAKDIEETNRRVEEIRKSRALIGRALGIKQKSIDEYIRVLTLINGEYQSDIYNKDPIMMSLFWKVFLDVYYYALFDFYLSLVSNNDFDPVKQNIGDFQISFDEMVGFAVKIGDLVKKSLSYFDNTNKRAVHSVDDEPIVSRLCQDQISNIIALFIKQKEEGIDQFLKRAGTMETYNKLIDNETIKEYVISNVVYSQASSVSEKMMKAMTLVCLGEYLHQYGSKY